MTISYHIHNHISIYINTHTYQQESICIYYHNTYTTPVIIMTKSFILFKFLLIFSQCSRCITIIIIISTFYYSVTGDIGVLLSLVPPAPPPAVCFSIFLGLNSTHAKTRPSTSSPFNSVIARLAVSKSLNSVSIIVYVYYVVYVYYMVYIKQDVHPMAYAVRIPQIIGCTL